MNLINRELAKWMISRDILIMYSIFLKASLKLIRESTISAVKFLDNSSQFFRHDKKTPKILFPSCQVLIHVQLPNNRKNLNGQLVHVLNLKISLQSRTGIKTKNLRERAPKPSYVTEIIRNAAISSQILICEADLSLNRSSN